MTRRSLIFLVMTGIFSIFRKIQPAMAASKASSDEWSLPESKWRERLSKDTYRVLRDEGTEQPFSSPLNNEKRKGIYHCSGCDAPLFSSESKFDSGTGWPSFWSPLPNAIDTKVDFKLIVPRTEYHCRTCGGHQGHVFDDGPRPTGKRYCNNGIALTFRPSN